MIQTTIGLDISKDHLEAHARPDGKSRRFPNTPAGHQALLVWMDAKAAPPARVVFEPTGPYHRALERALGRAGLPVVKINPRQARRFAEAIGTPAKTDPLDAAMLARMGDLLAPAARPVQSEAMAELKEFQMAREALIKDRTAAKNRAKTLSLALLKRQNAARLSQIEGQIQKLEEAILARIKADPNLANRFDILASIPGISRITACAILIEMPELGHIDKKQAAALAGLAPITRQSGNWTGKAAIRGGRARLRRALYMPALVAARFNPDLKAKYQHLIAAGKPAKVAITAIMRKLLVTANSLLRNNRKWTPNTP